MALYSSDMALTRRCEAAESANGFAMAAATPGAVAEPIAGGCALFAGAGSPMTHALGIGMGPVTKEEFDRLEAFFFDHGGDCLIDLCPMADVTVIEEVVKRGYQVIEFNNLMLREVLVGDAKCSVPADLRVRRVGPEQSLEWRRTVARGFSNLDEPPPDLVDLMASLDSFGEAYLADGGGGAMAVRDGIAMMFGDATVPEARNRGIQSALIRARLARAVALHADLAMVTVIPGTGSHRNYERAGFTLAYMRVNLKLPKP
jgi:GNAT superfamily N-acetyltransferase